jgi:GT2 family glycosyltransferase
VDYVSGADMFIRKSALEKTGLLDEDFFMYYEETELSYRIIKNNFKIAVIPEAKIIHFEGKSLIGFNLEKYKLMLKSEFLFFKKCYGKFITFILKVTLLLGCTVKLVLKFDAEQVDKFKLIIKSN